MDVSLWLPGWVKDVPCSSSLRWCPAPTGTRTGYAVCWRSEAWPGSASWCCFQCELTPVKVIVMENMNPMNKVCEPMYDYLSKLLFCPILNPLEHSVTHRRSKEKPLLAFLGYFTHELFGCERLWLTRWHTGAYFDAVHVISEHAVLVRRCACLSPHQSPLMRHKHVRRNRSNCLQDSSYISAWKRPLLRTMLLRCPCWLWILTRMICWNNYWRK